MICLSCNILTGITYNKSMIKKIFIIITLALLALLVYDWIFWDAQSLNNGNQQEITSYDVYYQEALNRNVDIEKKYSVSIDRYETSLVSENTVPNSWVSNLYGNQKKDTTSDSPWNFWTPKLQGENNNILNGSSASSPWSCSGIIFDPCIELFVKWDNFHVWGGMDFKSSTPDL